MSSLSEQLRRLQGQAESTKDKVKKGRASVLFDANVAADIDSDSIFTMGLNGYEELCSYDPYLEQYEGSLFSKAAYGCRRELQTAEFNNSLDNSISAFLRRASAYALLKPTHKIFEYFVRHFKVHEKNVDAFLEAVLPFHSTEIFLRVLSICAIEGTRWEFLSKAQRNSATVERKVLVTRCCDDMSLINFLCNSVRSVSDGTHQTKVRITFATAVLIEVLERCKNDQERKKSFFTRLLPYITDSIKCHTCFDFQLSGYMLVSSICRCGARLTQNLFAYLISLITMNMDESKLDVSIRCLVSVYQATEHQKISIPLPQKPYTKLRSMDTTLIKTLKSLVKNENIDISAFLSNFLSKMLQNMSTINTNTIHIFELLNFIIDELPLQKHVQNIVNNVFKTLSESRMLGSGEKDIVELRKRIQNLVASLSKKYPNLIDIALEHSFKTITETEKADAGKDASKRKKAVVKFITEVFSFSKHKLLKESKTTLFLALQNPLEAVRLEALETLHDMTQSLNDSDRSNASDKENNKDFIFQAICARLRLDESNQVLKRLVDVVNAVNWEWEEKHALGFLQSLSSALNRLQLTPHEDSRKCLFGLMGCNVIKVIFGSENMTNLWLKLLLDEIPPISLLHQKWTSFDTETAKLAIKIAMDSLHPLFGAAAKAKGTKRKKTSMKDDVSLEDLLSALQDRIASAVAKDIDSLLTRLESLQLKPTSLEFVVEALRRVCVKKLKNKSAVEGSVHKAIIRFSLKYIRQNGRSGRQAYFKSMVFEHAARLELGNRKNLRQALRDGINAFTRFEIQPVHSTEVYVIVSLYFALLTMSTDENSDNSCNGIQMILTNHFDNATLEVLLLVSTSLHFFREDATSSIVDIIEYQCWYLIDMNLKSIRDCVNERRAAKRGMKSVDFQLLIPYVLAAMRSRSKNVREKAYNILISHIRVVGTPIVYGLDFSHNHDIIRLPTFKKGALISTSSIDSLIEAFQSGENDVVNNTEGVNRCLQRCFGGNTMSEDEEEVLINWFIDYANFLLGKNEELSVLVLAALQKAPSAKVVKCMESLIDKLLDIYEMSPDGSSINKCFKACIYHFANDDENEKMEMSTVKTFLKILSSKIDREGAYMIQEQALHCLTAGFCSLLPREGTQQTFDILLEMLIKNHEHRFSRADIFEGIKNLELNSDTLLSYIEDLLAEIDERVCNKKKAKRKKKNVVSDDDETDAAGTMPKDLIARATILAEICNVKDEVAQSRQIAFCFLKILNIILGVDTDNKNQYSPTEYCKYIVMEAIRALLQSSILEGGAKGAEKSRKATKRKRGVATKSTEITKEHAETLVRCVQLTNSSQTRNSGLLLLAHLSKENPEVLLNALVPVFTYMGKSASVHDDNFTFHVVQRIVESVVSAVQEVQGKHNVTLRKLLNVFVEALEQMNPHRRQRLMFMVVSIMQPGALSTAVALLFSRNTSNDLNNAAGEKKKRQDYSFTTEDKIEFSLGLSHRFSAEEQAMMIARLLSTVIRETIFETSSNAYNGELLDQEVFINPQLVNVHEDCQNARLYVLDVLQFLSRHISSKGFLRRLVHSQYHNNGKTDTTNRIDRAFFHSCTDIISFMRHISHVQNQGDFKDRKFLDGLSTHLYTTLAKINAALSTPSFLTITADLLQHNDVLVRKTALSMFIEKIEDVEGSLTEEEIVMFLDMLEPIKSRLSSPSVKKSQIQDYQISIYTLDILVGAFGKGHPHHFKEFQVLLCQLLESTVCQDSVLLLNCTHVSLAKFCDTFGPSALPVVPKVMPSLLKSLDKFTDLDVGSMQAFSDTERDLLDTSLKALAIIVRRLPKFSTPYLNRLLSYLFTRAQGDLGGADELDKFSTELTSVVATAIESRVLLPILYNLFPTLTRSRHMCQLFNVLNVHIDAMSNDSVKKNYMQIFKLILQAFKGHDNLKFDESVQYRQCLLDAFVSLILKLNEKRMRPLFFKVKEFVLDDPNNTEIILSRNVLLYHLCEKLIIKLKSIFIPFLVYVYEAAIEEIKSFVKLFSNEALLKKVKSSSNLSWRVESLKHVLIMLEKCFVYDAAAVAIKGNEDYEKFVNKARFNTIVGPLTDILTCCAVDRVKTEVDYATLMESYLTPCIANLALAAGSDELWKALHHRLCLLTRHEKALGRYHALKTVHDCFELVGEEYLIMLPETISYLSELLEDKDTEVENLARTVKKMLEKMNGGESLDTYLFG